MHMMGCKWLPQGFGIKSDPGIIWRYSRKCMDSHRFSIVFSGCESPRATHANPKGGSPWPRSEIDCFIRVSALHVACGQFHVASRDFNVARASAAKARNTTKYNGFQPVPCGHRDSSDIAECPSGNPSVTHLAASRKPTFSDGFAYYHKFFMIPLTTHHMHVIRTHM